MNVTHDQVERLIRVLARCADVLERAHPEPPDRLALGDLLAEVARCVGDRPFTALDIAEHAEVVQDVALSAALVRVAGDPPSPRRLGSALRSAEHEVIGDYTVRRAGASRAGISWRVLPSASGQNPRAIA